MRRRLAAEFLGTYGLVFAGTGAIVVDAQTGGAVTHVGVALTFGLVVMSMIYAFGEVSGAHLNPAVTLGFWAAGRFPLRDVGPYAAAQFVGAVAASGTLRVLFPESETLGATTPTGPVAQTFVFEVILTCFLMVTILGVTSGAKEKGLLAGVAVGGVVAFEAMFAGPISGASMNPARSFGPALVSGDLAGLWIYVIAPVAGAALGVLCSQAVVQRAPAGEGGVAADTRPAR
ncbi:MAG: aquaporin [Phycisphaeraceae bacterium]|nr:aquaporin [Phycisphaeraceae bacterium]